ncbi:MAG: class I SAM-dependent methyltransferase [Coleofasciculus chthonoplastes F3-SA18-01]|uniref:class I SAM-dependent DNA methyltransferase n=1 Tax=Coleofasciculus chthonoplastes TaxID=64178 RepID=UPI0032F56862
MTKDIFPQVPERPNLYDWLYHKTTKDIEMYCHLTEGHESILECAVGTGRLAIPLAEKGRIVHGIDYSAAMLQKFKDKLADIPETTRNRIHLDQADMRDFDLNQKFTFVFVPFGSFVYLLTIEDQKSCLNCLRRHLADGGTLVIDLPTWEEARDEKWLNNDLALMKVKQAINPETGKTTEMWSTFRFDSSTQIMEQDRHYRIYAHDGCLEREQVVLWKSRFFFLGEFQLLLETCGLKISQVYGDFQFGAYRHNSEVAVVVIKAA